MNTVIVKIPITPELVQAVAEEIVKTKKSGQSRPWTVDELADHLGVSRVTIYRDIKAGKIRKVEGVSKTLIPANEVNRLLK